MREEARAIRRTGAIVLLVATALAPCAVGCNDAKTHVFSAQLYEQASDCLDDYKAIDVVAGGTGSARCAPMCLVAAGSYYVSTMCAPYPVALTPSCPDAAPDPLCIAALAAYAAGKSCSAPSDAGADAGDAALEGGDDGGGDGASDGGGDDGASDGNAGSDGATDGGDDAGTGDAAGD